MADQSIWKKEVSFVRKSEENARETDEPERPVWKQELSFVRKIKRDDAAEATALPEAAAEGEEPVVELPRLLAPVDLWPETDPEQPVEKHEQEGPTDHSSPVPGTVPEAGPDEPGAEPAPVLELPLAPAPVELWPDPDPEQPVDEQEEEAPTDHLSRVSGTVPEAGLDEPGPELAPLLELPRPLDPVELWPETHPAQPVEEHEEEAPTDHLSPVPGTVPEAGPDEPGAELAPVASEAEAAPEEPVEEHEEEAPTDHLSRVPGTVPEAGPDEPGAEPASVGSEAEAAAAAEEPVGEHEEEAPTDHVGPVPGTVPEAGPDEPGAELAPVGSEAEAAPEEPVEEHDEEPMWMRAVTFGSRAESQAPSDDEPRVEPAPVVDLPVVAVPAESELHESTDDSSPVPGTVPETGLDQPGAAESWSALSWLPAESVPAFEAETAEEPVGASKKGVPLLIGGCTALLVAALLGALFMTNSGKIASARRNLADLNSRAAALAPAAAGVGQQPLSGEQNAHAAALTTALSSRVSWDRVLRDVSLILPGDIRLTSLTASPTGGSTVPPMFTIRGRTSSQQSVERLLAGLRGQPDLTNVQLIRSTGAEFTIAADIASPAGGGS